MMLVAGATGSLGEAIATRLARDHSVRALTRTTSNPATIARLETAGVHCVVGDLKDRASLAKACKGTTSLFSTVSCTRSRQPGDTIESVDLKGQLDLLATAVEAGVQHVVYVSFNGGPGRYPLKDAKRTVEAAIRASGLTYTILRPGFFMEIWLGPALGLDLQGGTMRVFGSGHQPVHWVSLYDVADFAVASVRIPATYDRTFHLGGPKAASQQELVVAIEQETGRPLRLTYLPQDVLEAQRDAVDGDPLERSIAGAMGGLAAGDQIDSSEAFDLVQLRPRSVESHLSTLTTVGAGGPARA